MTADDSHLGLSDTLHQMASGDEPVAADHIDLDADEQALKLAASDETVILGALPNTDDPNADLAAQFADENAAIMDTGTTQLVATRGTHPYRRPAHRSRNHGFKTAIAPVLLAVGALLLVPAVWALLFMMNVQVWGYDRSNASAMAKTMLVCWPLSICLIAAGVVFIKQTRAPAGD